MTDASRRPFYAEYAWAFALLIDRPVRKECAAIATWLVERAVLPGAGLLDAGCGTGRYAIELAGRGYHVHGIDLSPELIDVAERSLAGAPGLARAGFGAVAYFGSYDTAVAVGSTDRLVAVAQLSRAHLDCTDRVLSASDHDGDTHE